MAKMEPAISGPVQFAADRSVQDTIDVGISNPVSQNIDVSITFGSDDSRWRFVPDHGHFTLAPGESSLTTTIARGPGVIDSTYRAPEVHTSASTTSPLVDGIRYRRRSSCWTCSHHPHPERQGAR